MLYRLSSPSPNLRYLHVSFSATIDAALQSVTLQLPSWRPGRYELGNFAKNVRDFRVTDENGNKLDFRKLNKDSWQVWLKGGSNIKVEYAYYAAEFNAGSTYVDSTTFYVNPVNCCIYIPGREQEACQVELDLPDTFKVGTSMEALGNNRFLVPDFHSLADSPVLAASDLHTVFFQLEDKPVYLHIKGQHQLNLERLAEHMAAYSREQVAAFGHYPCKNYHYLFFFPPYKHHHGVEHENSTVIVLGPGDKLQEEEHYHELLAISSHEFYHLWNIKRIRPVEMWPYDYTRENYSTLGFVYEGVTTYMGDAMLLRSGVFNFDEYSYQFNADLQKHFDNAGRYRYSVAESSFDTWLDGYVPGVPERKVSIYVEGLLAALILDIEILERSGGHYRLDDVMRHLYEHFFMQGKGYTYGDYRAAAEHYAGADLGWYFERFITGRGEIEKQLPQTLVHIGLEIHNELNPNLFERYFGVHLIADEKGWHLDQPLENSPADKAGLSKNDHLVMLNGHEVLERGVDLNPWIDGAPIVRAVFRNPNETKEVILERDTRTYMPVYGVRKMMHASPEARTLFAIWAKQPF